MYNAINIKHRFPLVNNLEEIIYCEKEEELLKCIDKNPLIYAMEEDYNSLLNIDDPHKMRSISYPEGDEGYKMTSETALIAVVWFIRPSIERILEYMPQ